jgi:uncharacterized protein (DUF169 family)
MTEPASLYKKIIDSMEVPGLLIPTTCVKFYKKGEQIPKELWEYHTTDLTLTSCQANKQASLGDVVLLTRENIGCIAAAITFGLAGKDDDSPFAGSRVYTDIMKDQSGQGDNFKPPTPKDFTDGLVYACHDSGNKHFCLFGEEDSGRFRTTALAKKAVSEMIALQPAETQAVFFFSPDFDDIEIDPQVVTMSVRPVELTRLIQAWQFETGERIEANMGPVRVVNSDLIVRPLLTGKINVSTYCLGARLIAQYEAERLGIGIPWEHFKTMAKGMEASRTGYPFSNYPGAKNI